MAPIFFNIALLERILKADRPGNLIDYYYNNNKPWEQIVLYKVQ